MEWKRMRVNWKRGLFGAGVSVVAMMALTGCGAWLLSEELLDVAWMDYLAAGILLVSALLGAAAGGAEPLTGLVSAGGFWLVLLAVNALIFGGVLPGFWAVLAGILGGAGAGILAGTRPKGRRGGRHRRYRHR